MTGSRLFYVLPRLCASAILFCGSSFASGAPDVGRIIDEALASAVSARVVTITPGLLLPYRVSEAEINRRGCVHHMQMKADINALGDILRRGRIVAFEPKNQYGQAGIDARLAIYLNRQDGTTVRLLFETLFPAPVPAYGWLNDDISVKALNPAFALTLHQWTNRRTSQFKTICGSLV